MSQNVEIKTSKADNINGSTGKVNGEQSAMPRIARNGRGMNRVDHSYPSERSRYEPVHSVAPTRTMTASAGQENPGAGLTGRRVVHFSLPKGDSSPLRTCTNAWIPSRMRTETTEQSQHSTDEEAQIIETRKKFMSILNKVTPENIHLMTDQIMALPIETEQCLRKAIELLFQKAIDEPNFTPQYARICTDMHKKDNKRTSGTNPKMTFKKLLTVCCQDRIAEMKAHDEALGKVLKNIDECNDQDEKAQIKSKYNQDESNYRRKSVGNCRFMCEMYKVEMLTRHTLEMSLKYLLKTPKEETLECACNILKHTGNTISHKASFNKLTEYTSSEWKSKIPTRIRFLMEETIDLKEHNWVPRNNRPKSPITALPYIKKPILQEPVAQPTTTNKKEVVTEVQKVNVVQINRVSNATKLEGLKQQSLPVKDTIKSYASLVSPIATQATESANLCQPSDDEILKKFLSIVDNLCPENVVPMTQSILALPIITETCLKGVVDIVYQKALSEPELSPQYAHICSAMKNIKVPSDEHKITNTTFRVLLIALCQNTFESMSTRKALLAKDRIHIETCKDRETRRILLAEFDKNELNYKRRSVANCSLITELLNVKVLVPPIVEMCAEKLVETIKETSLECLYVIVKHTGLEINHEDIFQRLYEYSTGDKHKLSSRVRSIIQDTLELNKTDWTPRHTIDRPPLSDQVVSIRSST